MATRKLKSKELKRANRVAKKTRSIVPPSQEPETKDPYAHIVETPFREKLIHEEQTMKGIQAKLKELHDILIAHQGAATMLVQLHNEYIASNQAPKIIVPGTTIVDPTA